MNWESFYLVCFVAGFSLSVLALLGRLPQDRHLLHRPHLGVRGAHGGRSQA
jgi:hypothetical protein